MFVVIFVAAAPSAHYWPYLKFTREFEICAMTHLITDLGAVGRERLREILPANSVPLPLDMAGVSTPTLQPGHQLGTLNPIQAAVWILIY